MAERQIQLTDEAKKRLDTAVDEYESRILELLEHEKFVPGERVIEITASDVEQAVGDFRYGSNRRNRNRLLYSKTAFLVGVACVSFGTLYPMLQSTFNNPTQFIPITAGLYLMVFGFVVSQQAKLGLRETKSSADQSIGDRISRLERLLEDVNRDDSSHLTKR